jgi:hypothetical protein
VSISIDDEQAIADGGQHVRVGNEVSTPCGQGLARRVERDHARLGWVDQRVKAQQDVDLAGRIDGDIGDPAAAAGQRAERPLHAVAPCPKRHNQLVFHGVSSRSRHASILRWTVALL